jgi:hypothetical protein
VRRFEVAPVPAAREPNPIPQGTKGGIGRPDATVIITFSTERHKRAEKAAADQRVSS